MTLKRRLPVVVVVGVLALSCRDGVPPFMPDELEPGPQITFGAGQDRDPRWTPDGAHLLYHTDDYIALPGAGVLLRIPAEGGVATPLLEDAQRAFGGRMLATPVPSPNGQAVAYLDLIRVDAVAVCLANAAQPPSADCTSTQPLLDSAALRVRAVNAAQPPLADPAVGIKLAGVDPGFRVGDGPYVMQTLPFQRQHRELGAVLLRPSWAPDNQRIVFSNGTELFIWRVGDAAAARVPGSDDGVSPAWSPAGDRIAFTVLARIDSTEIRCACVQPGEGGATPTVFSHQRMLYTESPRVVVMRPDGSERIELGAGLDPAWSPDGQFIYMHRDGDIVRVPVAGGSAQTIPNTRHGRYPAVSPDGTQLAFSRLKLSSRIDYDIWVVPLQP